MKITKEDRHEFSKKRRKLVRKGLNPYDDKMLINLDKEWAQLRCRIIAIKFANYGSLKLMNDFENEYYYELGIDSELNKIRYELNILRGLITDSALLEEFNAISNSLFENGDAESYLNLKRLIVKLQAKMDIPIHFYEALDEEYKHVYQKVMSDTFRAG